MVLQFTGQECDVLPYDESAPAAKNVPIAHVATAWQSPVTGETYILVLNEVIWMGNTLPHTLINPNQLRHHCVRVQDDSTSFRPLSIIFEEGGVWNAA